MSIARQRLGKHIPKCRRSTIEERALLGNRQIKHAFLTRRCFQWGTCRGVIRGHRGGGVEYLHRDPASRRRRRKGKSKKNWDSKIWSRDPRDSDPRKTALARTSSIYNRQTRPLVREGALQKQDRKRQAIIKGSTPRLTDWPTVSRNVTLTWDGVQRNSGVVKCGQKSRVSGRRRWRCVR
jgi:hypothetical protein